MHDTLIPFRQLVAAGAPLEHIRTELIRHRVALVAVAADKTDPEEIREFREAIAATDSYLRELE